LIDSREERKGKEELYSESKNFAVNYMLNANAWKKKKRKERNMIDEEINKGALLQVTRANS